MTNGSMIVVGASEEEFDHVKQCLSDWQCVAAPLNDIDEIIEYLEKRGYPLDNREHLILRYNHSKSKCFAPGKARECYVR